MRLPGKRDSISHGARPVRGIVSVIDRIRTRRVSRKNSLPLSPSLSLSGVGFREAPMTRRWTGLSDRGASARSSRSGPSSTAAVARANTLLAAVARANTLLSGLGVGIWGFGPMVGGLGLRVWRTPTQIAGLSLGLGPNPNFTCRLLGAGRVHQQRVRKGRPGR